ncbi:FixH family protein [Epilithonimonas ginsengisoli]|uniref:FixH family protein n=1 Tax=Epilithonimonas ginsengisoli TaxID=1245592 RepID=A0ABU4JG20_9FLAO|nr:MULTISPECIES: FixH family protein [Chryseobacterium group]MBV6879252.1 FixH family protein [Epilithonimonas sp. FP105]MDW8548623.1 FixH family protein [Epilithonimonas ginsengisoli]OAH75497.1 nitrogen fixation protein FixH [Chryseobacterium sp. FP211-J200]
MKKLNWGHGLMIALGCFILFILFLILVFPIGKQNADMISDNYYEEELKYQDVIDAKENAAQLKEVPAYKATAEGMEITFPQSIKVDNNKVEFILFRTEDSNLDIKKELNLENHKFVIPKKVVSLGSYTLKLKWTENKKPYQVDYDILWN